MCPTAVSTHRGVTAVSATDDGTRSTSDEVVAMADELRDEPRTRGGLARLLGSKAAGRSAVTAFGAGIAGTAAFVASLLVDWQHVTLGRPEIFSVDEEEFAVGLDSASYAVAYLLGMLALLALLGVVVGRPELARRLRMGATALGVGIVGVLVAIMDQLQNVMNQIYGFSLNFGGGIPPEIQQIIDNTTYTPLPGQFIAFAAVLVLVAGVWLAAGQVPDRSATAPVGVAAGHVLVPAIPASAVPAPAPPGPSAGVSGATVSADLAAAPISPSPVGPPGLPPDAPSGGRSTRVGYADGLTVTSSDVTDPGSQADILRS